MNTLPQLHYIRKPEVCHQDTEHVYLYTMSDGDVHFGTYRSPLGGLAWCRKPVTSIEVRKNGTWTTLEGW